MRIQTLVVIDHKTDLQIKDLIERLTAKLKYIDIVKMAGNQAVIERVQHMPPDVIILPITQAGFAKQCNFVREIRVLSPHTQFLALCEPTITPNAIVKLFGTGVMGYAYMPIELDAFVKAIHMAFKEEAMVDRHVAALLLQVMRPYADSFLGLLSYEIDILEYLALGHALNPTATDPAHRPQVAQSHLGNVVLKFAAIWKRQQTGATSSSPNAENEVHDTCAPGIIQFIEQELLTSQNQQNEPDDPW